MSLLWVPKEGKDIQYTARVVIRNGSFIRELLQMNASSQTSEGFKKTKLSSSLSDRINEWIIKNKNKKKMKNPGMHSLMKDKKREKDEGWLTNNEQSLCLFASCLHPRIKDRRHKLVHIIYMCHQLSSHMYFPTLSLLVNLVNASCIHLSSISFVSQSSFLHPYHLLSTVCTTSSI